jgi:hypothetical protein
MLMFHEHLLAQYENNNCRQYRRYLKKFSEPKKLKTSQDTISYLNCIRGLVNDSLEFSKAKEIVNLTAKLAPVSASLNVKQAAIDIYFTLLKVKTERVFNISLLRLKRFDRDCFDSLRVNNFTNLLDSNTTNLKEYIKFLGFIGNKTTGSKIKELLYSSERKFSNSELWSIYLSLARLGDTDAIDFLASRVSKLQLNSRLVEAVYPDLVYTRQKKLYDLMIDAIYSDELLCDSPNPDSDKMVICGYRIIEILAPNIKEFPIKTFPSGDLDVENYPEALKQARDWFVQNRSNYKIVKEKY